MSPSLWASYIVFTFQLISGGIKPYFALKTSPASNSFPIGAINTYASCPFVFNQCVFLLSDYIFVFCFIHHKKCTSSYFFNSLGKENTGMAMILIAKINGVMIFHIAIDTSILDLFTLHRLLIRKLWEINITW